jgi:hypothetical protein
MWPVGWRWTCGDCPATTCNTNSSSNGYDTLTIDSDFYGYAISTTGSTAAFPSNNSWSLPSDTQDPHHWKRRRKAEIKIRLQLECYGC